jgi:DNA-binding NarL/FixJ family response regulator
MTDVEPIPDHIPFNRVLSVKELAITLAVANGKKNKAIAEQIGTTTQVIKNNLRFIYRITGCADRLELAIECYKQGLIDPRGDKPNGTNNV